MRLSADEVAQYLKEHPEFFDEYADMLAEIYVPHPLGGRAIPIAERQIVTLRDRNRLLEEKLREFVHFGQKNDTTMDRMHRVTLEIIAAPDFEAVVSALNSSLREDFGIPAVALRLWKDGEDCCGLGPAGPEARAFAESLAEPYFSATPMFETLGWFSHDGPALASFGYVALHAGAVSGLLAMGSEDPERFRPDMGALYLTRLAEMIGAVLRRCLPAAA